MYGDFTFLLRSMYPDRILKTLSVFKITKSKSWKNLKMCINWENFILFDRNFCPLMIIQYAKESRKQVSMNCASKNR